MKHILIIFSVLLSLTSNAQDIKATTTSTTTVTGAVSFKDLNDVVIKLGKKIDSLANLINKAPGVKVYKNTKQTTTLKCPTGTTGVSVTSSVPAGTFTSTVSQAAVNKLAKDSATLMATLALKCTGPPPPTVYSNVKQTVSCPSGTTGQDISVAAGLYTSAVSQADADNQALSWAKSKLSCVTPPPPTGGFHAYAGPDQVIQFPTNVAILDGSGSTGNPVKWEWTNVKGRGGYYVAATAITVNQLTPGEYAFELKVTDASGNISKDTVNFTVLPQTVFTNNQRWVQDSSLGTIVKGSYTITLKSDITLKPGDYVIVTNNEKRGNIGIGGQWPYTFYGSLSQMNADKTKPDGFYAGNTETGEVFRWYVADQQWQSFHKQGYYAEKITPHALRAKVLAVSADGHLITLDKAASSTGIDCWVYYDEYYLIQGSINDHNEYVNGPEGNYHIGWPIYAVKGFKGIIGAGEAKTVWISPDGTPSLHIGMDGLWDENNKYNAIISDITLIGNGRSNGFRFTEDDADGLRYPVTETYENPYLQQQTISMSSHYGRVLRVTVIDYIGYAIQLTGRGIHAIDCHIISTQGVFYYDGWAGHIQGENLTNDSSYFLNCTYYSPTLADAFEAFRTQKGAFINCSSVNGVCAFNASEHCGFVNFRYRNTVNAFPILSFSNPIIDVNGFMGNSSGNYITNMDIEQVPMRLNDSVYITLNGVYGRKDAAGIQVVGGRFARPDGTGISSSLAVHLDNGDGAVIDGLTVIGTMAQPFHNFPSLDAANIGIKTGAGTVRNCTADMIVVGPDVTLLNNKANVEVKK